MLYTHGIRRAKWFAPTRYASFAQRGEVRLEGSQDQVYGGRKTKPAKEVPHSANEGFSAQPESLRAAGLNRELSYLPRRSPPAEG